MGINDTKVGPMSISQLFMLLGSVVALVAIFLAWGEITLDSIIGITSTESYTGLDFILNEAFEESEDYQIYLPIATTVLAALGLICSLCSVGMPGNKVLPALNIVFGILITMSVYLFVQWFSAGSFDWILIDATTHIGIGANIAALSGVVIFVFGIINAFRKV